MGGIGALMAFVVVGCVGVMAQRYVAKRSARKVWLERPGCSASSPVQVSRFDDIDSFVRAQRCTCGGRCVLRSEGGTSEGAIAVRVVRGECDRCEDEMSFYFELSEVQH